jgi:nucleotide-binding universal stress UspA family protein
MAGVLLVPLDGSDLAEAALPLASLLAKRLQGRLVLLSAIDPADTRGDGEGALERYNAHEAEARRYLDSAVTRLASEGVSATVDIRGGPADEEIEAAAVDVDAAFVVMATHGRSGIGRWFRGSVADKVIRRGTAPVLVIKPGDQPATAASISRIVVPLDQSPLAEAAVAPALELARAFDADLDFVHVASWVVAPYARAPQSGIVLAEVEEEIESEALAYVERVREGTGYAKAHGAVLRGNAAEELATYARHSYADLFVMTTHGRSGFVRMALGSTADRVVAEGAAPVLLVRPVQPGAEQPVRRRRCFNCGRPAPLRDIPGTDRCVRCNHHLHVCDNCVFWTGAVCLRDRPEVGESPHGITCPEFLFRETAGASPDRA